MQLKKKNNRAFNSAIILLYIINIQSPAIAITDEEASLILSRILASPSYCYEENTQLVPPNEKSKIEKLLEKIRMLGPFFRKIYGTFTTASSLFAGVIYLSIFGIFIVGIIVIIKKIRLKFPRDINHKIDRITSKDFTILLDHARILASQGLLKEAIQSTIKALWFFYHSNGYIRYRKELTNREILSFFKYQSFTSLIEEIVLLCERAVYECEVTASETFENIFHKVSTLINQ
ncbi:MAG: hypothetical protein N2316_07415 [Spirochaetes bacterium]|nr:hypothetical protein [Spirochaetota bacterium]